MDSRPINRPASSAFNGKAQPSNGIGATISRRVADKGSIRGKLKRAGWNDAYLLSLLRQMR